MKSWLKASLKLAGLSFVSGSIIFLFWYLAYTSSVKSHVESVCSSIAPYLQIGSYRWAEDLANGSLSGSYPELIVQISQSGNSLSLIHISEPTRQAEISYAVFCLK